MISGSAKRPLIKILDSTLNYESYNLHFGVHNFYNHWSYFTPSLGGYPTLCGGIRDKFLDYVTDLCYQYDPEMDNWFESGRLQTQRDCYGYDYSDSWGMVITGGYESYYFGLLDSVEVTRDGFTFEMYQPMPVKRARHCTAIVDDDRHTIPFGYFYKTNLISEIV